MDAGKVNEVDLGKTRTNLFEFTLVITFAVITSVFILREMIFSPGYVAVRDSVPIFYSDLLVKQTMFSSSTDLINYMDFANFPLVASFYLGVLHYAQFEKLTYLFFPFLFGEISFYYSFSYFAKNYIPISAKSFSTKYLLVVIGLLFSFVYVTLPASAYFSFWAFNATFIAFSPLLIAASDHLYNKVTTTKRIVLPSLILSIIWALSTADPRSLVYSLFIFVSFSAYYFLFSPGIRIKVVWGFITALIFYILIELRIILLVLLSVSNYTQISGAILVQQHWALTYFFPINAVFSNTALYWQWVLYDHLIWASYFGIVIGFIYIVFNYKSKTPLFLFVIYLLIVIDVSDTFGFGSVFGLVVSKYFATFAFIFYPMYLMELLVPLSVLFFSLGVSYIIFQFLGERTDVKWKNKNFIIWKRKSIHVAVILLIFFMIFGQISFNYPTYSTGNYSGMYNPVEITPAMKEAGTILENSSGYNLLIQPNLNFGPNWTKNETLEQLLFSYKNVIAGSTADLGVPNLANSLLYRGVQNVVINNITYNYSSVISNLTANRNFQLSFDKGGLYIFQNKQFRSLFTQNGILLDFNWPYSSLVLDSLNSSLANLPYYGQYFPLDYVTGLIGINITLLDLESILTYNYNLNLSSLVSNQVEPNPTSPGESWESGPSFFPIGSNGIGINGKISQTLCFHTKPGNYTVMVAGLTLPNFGYLKVFSGTEGSSNISLKNPYASSAGVNWFETGNIFSNGTIKFQNDGALYLTSIRVIPTTQINHIKSEAINFSKLLTIYSAQTSTQSQFLNVNNSVYLYNTTVPGYPYLLVQHSNISHPLVTFIVDVTHTTFGIGNTLSSKSTIFSSYYSSTTYYYLILGTNYTISNDSEVNNNLLIEANLVTASSLAVWVYIRRKR